MGNENPKQRRCTFCSKEAGQDVFHPDSFFYKGWKSRKPTSCKESIRRYNSALRYKGLGRGPIKESRCAEPYDVSTTALYNMIPLNPERIFQRNHKEPGKTKTVHIKGV